jgi:hypothetical protein
MNIMLAYHGSPEYFKAKTSPTPLCTIHTIHSKSLLRNGSLKIRLYVALLPEVFSHGL